MAKATRSSRPDPLPRPNPAGRNGRHGNSAQPPSRTPSSEDDVGNACCSASSLAHNVRTDHQPFHAASRRSGTHHSRSGPALTEVWAATAQAQADLIATASDLYRRIEQNPQGLPDDDAYWTSLPAHLRTFIRNALPLGQFSDADLDDPSNSQASTRAMIAVAQQLAHAAHASQRHLQQCTHGSQPCPALPFDPAIFADLALHPAHGWASSSLRSASNNGTQTLQRKHHYAGESCVECEHEYYSDEDDLIEAPRPDSTGSFAHDRLPAHDSAAPSTGKKSKKKKKKKVGAADHGDAHAGTSHASDTAREWPHEPAAPTEVPPSAEGRVPMGETFEPSTSRKSPNSRAHAGLEMHPASSKQTQPMAHQRIWSSSTMEERERIKDFWIGLSEEKRRSLLQVERDAVLRKMKYQSRHACSCTVCGRKRSAIESELDVLYDAYHQDLEVDVSQQHKHMGSDGAAKRGPMPPSDEGDLSGDDLDVRSDASGYEQEDEEESEEGTEDEDVPEGGEGRLAAHRQVRQREDQATRRGDTSRGLQSGSDGVLASLGSAFTIKGDILTVADDLIKNEGRKFLEMLEHLALHRMQREEDAAAVLDSMSEDGGQRQEGYEDEGEEAEEEPTLSDAQRREEGRRMFHIFAARLFEQRVLAAYREHVAQERQLQLLRELEEEDAAQKEREAKRTREQQRKKDKKRQAQLKKEEERLQRESEKAVEEAAARERLEQQRAADRKKQEEIRSKREADKRAKEAERLKKDEERRKRQEEEKAREAQKERVRKEKEAREAKEAAERKAEEAALQRRQEATAAKEPDKKAKKAADTAIKATDEVHRTGERSAKAAAQSSIDRQTQESRRTRTGNAGTIDVSGKARSAHPGSTQKLAQSAVQPATASVATNGTHAKPTSDPASSHRAEPAARIHHPQTPAGKRGRPSSTSAQHTSPMQQQHSEPQPRESVTPSGPPISASNAKAGHVFSPTQHQAARSQPMTPTSEHSKPQTPSCNPPQPSSGISARFSRPLYSTSLDSLQHRQGHAPPTSVTNGVLPPIGTPAHTLYSTREQHSASPALNGFYEPAEPELLGPSHAGSPFAPPRSAQRKSTLPEDFSSFLSSPSRSSPTAIPRPGPIGPISRPRRASEHQKDLLATEPTQGREGILGSSALVGDDELVAPQPRRRGSTVAPIGGGPSLFGFGNGGSSVGSEHGIGLGNTAAPAVGGFGPSPWDPASFASPRLSTPGSSRDRGASFGGASATFPANPPTSSSGSGDPWAPHTQLSSSGWDRALFAFDPSLGAGGQASSGLDSPRSFPHQGIGASHLGPFATSPSSLSAIGTPRSIFPTPLGASASSLYGQAHDFRRG